MFVCLFSSLSRTRVFSEFESACAGWCACPHNKMPLTILLAKGCWGAEGKRQEKVKEVRAAATSGSWPIGTAIHSRSVSRWNALDSFVDKQPSLASC